ncbi:MAG: Na/Pi cotransporter family protein [Chromatiaceae bacterium]|nr:Na/Pi cotransporter family protein [Chromatiaceae bacterium]
MNSGLDIGSKYAYWRLGLALILVVAASFVMMPVLAASSDSEEGIEWGVMAMTMLGGLAVFLYGMEQMAEALKKVAGESMKQILARLTSSRVMGLITGAFITAIIQSSSVTTVMLVGFVTAGLMSLTQAIGVILGADIGTTITAQIVAFKVTKYALLLVAVGFAMIFTGRNERIKQYGNLVMGLGMIFFGMGIMSEGMRPLRDYEPFILLMQNVSNPLVGILVATIFTSLIQSSSATMGVVIALALQGLITLEAGIALALGANIGTCATAGLAAIGKPREAVRVAVAHVTFKIIGVALILPFIPYFAVLVRDLSPAAAGTLVGMDRLAAETPRQIANAHTLFNIGIALVFLPFSNQFARFCEWIVPDRPLSPEEGLVRPSYLDVALIDTPTLALERARLEIGHMGDFVNRMLLESIPALLSGKLEQIREISAIDDKVDILYAEIVAYLGKVGKKELTDSQAKQLSKLLAAVNDLENIGDLIETNALDLAEQCADQHLHMSDVTKKVLTDLHTSVAGSVEVALRAVIMNDAVAARVVIGMKRQIQEQVTSAELHEARRLVANAPNRVAVYSVEVELIEKLKRVYYFAKRMAKTIDQGNSTDASVKDVG